jgi:transcriptional regulator with XRE-family HTH domain
MPLEKRLFATRLQELVARTGSQRKFGQLAGIRQQVISGYVNGANLPSIGHAVKIAEAGQVPITWLLGLERSGPVGVTELRPRARRHGVDIELLARILGIAGEHKEWTKLSIPQRVSKVLFAYEAAVARLSSGRASMLRPLRESMG